MIVGNGKQLKELMEYLRSYESVLIVGCGDCMTVCHAGGKKEVDILAAQIEMAYSIQNRKIKILKEVTERQCDREFLEDLLETIKGVECVLALGCGAGVQLLAEMAPEIPVFPGLNTKFIGVNDGHSKWVEKCSGCGNCILGEFGGFCPITSCAKSLMNGPCGGSSDGQCEIDPEMECVWNHIVDRMIDRGELENLMEVSSPHNWDQFGI